MPHTSSEERDPQHAVLVYRLGSLGDTVLALPAFHAIRKRFPQSRIVVLTNRPVHAKAAPLMAVLENTGLVDEAIDYPIGVRGWRTLWHLRGEIARRRFAVAVNLAAPRGYGKSLRDYAFFQCCGIRNVVGTPFRARDLKCLQDSATGLYEWEANRLARRVQTLVDIDVNADESWDLRLTPSERCAAQQLLANAGIQGPFIAVSVGTKVQAKDWGEQNWLSLISRLAARHSAIPLVAIGAAEESARTELCLQNWPGRTFNLCGRTNVRSTAAVLEGAQLFIGHDSGPMHLAAAVHVPCVAIFAARNLPGQWYPRGNSNTVIYNKVDCFGCGLETCALHQKKCITSISVEEVEQAVTKHPAIAARDKPWCQWAARKSVLKVTNGS